MLNYFTPLDVATYAYCPILFKNKKFYNIEPKLTLTERTIKETIINGEGNACLKDSVVDNRKLMRVWEKIWWPRAAKENISILEAETISIKAIRKLSDYCKYEITDWLFPTAGVEVESSIKINNLILKAKANIVKVDLESKKINKVLITIGKRDLSISEAAIDPFIKALVYSFR